MPRCACASEVYGSVFVCVYMHVCGLIQLLKDQSSTSIRVSIGFYSHVYLDFNSWIGKIMLGSRVMPSFTYLECHCSLFRRVCT